MNNSVNNSVLMFSGGLDPLIAYHFLDKPQCIHVDLHTPYSFKEREAVIRLADELDDEVNIIDINFIYHV